MPPHAFLVGSMKNIEANFLRVIKNRINKNSKCLNTFAVTIQVKNDNK